MSKRVRRCRKDVWVLERVIKMMKLNCWNATDSKRSWNWFWRRRIRGSRDLSLSWHRTRLKRNAHLLTRRGRRAPTTCRKLRHLVRKCTSWTESERYFVELTFTFWPDFDCEIVALPWIFSACLDIIHASQLLRGASLNTRKKIVLSISTLWRLYFLTKGLTELRWRHCVRKASGTKRVESSCRLVLRHNILWSISWLTRSVK